MKTTKRLRRISGISFFRFILILLSVKFINVAPIGPQNSKIGLSNLNNAVKSFFGYSEMWYEITEIMGYMAIAVAGCFGLLGLYQLVKYKSIKKVDSDIILLGVLYAAVVILYGFFEVVVINYRPVLVDGVLEASFPSSHTMLVVTVMASAVYQSLLRIRSSLLCNISVWGCTAVALITVYGRMACGVHWFTDIVAAVLLSAGLVFGYIALCRNAAGNRHLRYTGR